MQQIGKPLLDYHAWRQCETAAIARNLYRHGLNLFWPQVDWAGIHPGYVGMEFPLFQGTVALLYRLFGLDDSVGRGVSVLFSIGAVVLLYRFVLRLYDPRTAFIAALIFALMPLYVVLSQQFMPDVMMLSLTVGAIFFLYVWYADDRPLSLAVSGVLFMLALLVKIPTGTHYLPIAHIFYLKYGGRFLKKWPFWAYVAITLLPSLVWYQHALGVSQHYYPYHMFGAIDHGRGVLLSNLAPVLTIEFYLKISLRVLGLILTPVGFWFFIVGLISPSRRRDEHLLYSWLISLVAYLLLFAHGNLEHGYYQIVLAPLCAIFIAKGALWLHNVNEVRGALATLVPNCVRCLSKTQQTGAVSASVILFLIWTLVITARYLGDLSESPYLRAAEAIKRLTRTEDLLIISDGSNPITLYLSERKGWPFPPSMIENGARKPGWSVPAFEELVNSGATYFVVITSRSRLGESL
jgi:4-amino-4-deoxy-L-arabinose transferase-like glycosyltransferase